MHVHGKRKHKEHKNSNSYGQRGRPSKPHVQSAQNMKNAVLDKLQRHHLQKQMDFDSKREKLSRLERLPVELIQQIFFAAVEINLARASRYLQQALSNESIYNALVVFAFFDDDGSNPVDTKLFYPAEYRMLDVSEKVRLQKDIFTCRWCTYDRINACLPILSRLVMAQAWYAEHDWYESQGRGIGTAHDNTLVVLNEAIRDIAPLPNLEEQAKLESHFLARTKPEELGTSMALARNNHTTYLPRIVTWSSSLDEYGNLHKSTDRLVSTLAVRYIPDRVLSKSWTSEQIAFVQLLRQGYMFTQDYTVMDISATAVFEGIRIAIQEGNAVALKTLLEMHNAFFKSGESSFQSMISAPLIPPSDHPLPLDLFHLASQQGAKATDLILLLLRAGIDALPRDDPIITAWAVHQAQENNVLAIWLLNFMEGATDLGLPPGGYLFIDGCLSWRVNSEAMSFPESSFAGELGYLTGV